MRKHHGRPREIDAVARCEDALFVQSKQMRAALIHERSTVQLYILSITLLRHCDPRYQFWGPTTYEKLKSMAFSKADDDPAEGTNVVARRQIICYLYLRKVSQNEPAKKLSR